MIWLFGLHLCTCVLVDDDGIFLVVNKQRVKPIVERERFGLFKVVPLSIEPFGKFTTSLCHDVISIEIIKAGRRRGQRTGFIVHRLVLVFIAFTFNNDRRCDVISWAVDATKRKAKLFVHRIDTAAELVRRYRYLQVALLIQFNVVVAAVAVWQVDELVVDRFVPRVPELIADRLVMSVNVGTMPGRLAAVRRRRRRRRLAVDDALVRWLHGRIVRFDAADQIITVALAPVSYAIYYKSFKKRDFMPKLTQLKRFVKKNIWKVTWHWRALSELKFKHGLIGALHDHGIFARLVDALVRGRPGATASVGSVEVLWGRHGCRAAADCRSRLRQHVQAV